jgi:hypothetical protein
MVQRSQMDRADIYDPAKIFAAITVGLQHTKGWDYFIDTLRSFMLFPSNSTKRYVFITLDDYVVDYLQLLIRARYWQLLLIFVKQMLLQKDGENIDPDMTLLNINIDSVIRDMTGADNKVKNLEEKIKKEWEETQTQQKMRQKIEVEYCKTSCLCVHSKLTKVFQTN